MIPLVDLTSDKKLLSEIKKEVNTVVDSQSYVLGQRLASFEKKFASFIGAKAAIGVGNGTQALSLSLRALGIGRGDKVLTVAFSSPFTTISIIEEGATPVFCDVDEKTWTIDPHDAALKIDNHTRAIMPVHIYGNPCNMKALIKLARVHKLKIVEDACQAHNASIGERKVGTFGDSAAFSFYPTKNLGAFGDGGMVTTNNPHLAKMITILRHGGQTKRFWHAYRGVNSRLDEIQAAILEVKLKRLEEHHKKREVLAQRYRENLGDLPITFQETIPAARHAMHLFVIRTTQRGKLRKFLFDKGIGNDVYYPYPIHLQPIFSKYFKGKLAICEMLSKELIALPLYPHLSDRDQNYVITMVKKFFTKK